MNLRAQVVLPITAPPIRDGVVETSGRRIQGVRRWRELSSSERSKVIDLGEAILMPGLVNAHCHLDYTHMAGQIAPPKRFTDWLKLIVSTKAGWNLADYAASWAEGAAMLLRSGTTTVADIEAVPQLLPEMWKRTPLRVISFLEMITISRSPEAVLKETLAKLCELPGASRRTGLSPHAPYTTVQALLQETARIARKRRLLLTTHIAESAAEYGMFVRGEGEMYEWLHRSGRDMSDCGHCSPVQHYAKAGMLGRNVLATHLNYLANGDARLLGQRGVSVAHCPRSHFYFQHGPFPLRRLLRQGVNVCLGTDSLVTVYRKRNETVSLDMFAEMRALQARESWLTPRTIVRMATVNGARALGRGQELGQLARGALADVIAITLPAGTRDPYEAVLEHCGDVQASMIDGGWTRASARRPDFPALLRTEVRAPQ